ncbi:TPA: fimbrial protein [Enterobacter bugandensis]
MSVIRPLIMAALLVAPTFHAQSYDVLISVTGNLTGNTCTVAADSLTLNVPLGTIGLKQFTTTAGVSQLASPFTLTLEECGQQFAGVKIKFSGTPDDNNPQLIKLAEGGAQGVAVELLDKDSAPVPLDKPTSLYGVTGDTRVQMTFYARLAATGAPLSAGDVSAIATWTTEYQ